MDLLLFAAWGLTLVLGIWLVLVLGAIVVVGTVKRDDPAELDRRRREVERGRP